MSATSSILVRNMWCAIKEVSWFFSNSPKRQQCLHKIIEEKMPNATKRKLVDLCRTRWVARNNALSAFHQLYPAVVHALTAISSESGWNADSSSKATSFFEITQFPFIATFIVTSKIMAYTAQLTIGLQKKALDIVKAYQHIKVVMDTVDSVRQSADEYHEKWFIETVCGYSTSYLLKTNTA